MQFLLSKIKFSTGSLKEVRSKNLFWGRIQDIRIEGIYIEIRFSCAYFELAKVSKVAGGPVAGGLVPVPVSSKYLIVMYCSAGTKAKLSIYLSVSSNMIKSRHNWWSTDTEVVQSRIHQKNIDRALSMKFHCPFQTR